MGNKESCGFGAVNNTKHNLTVCMSMGATHYFENDIAPGEVFYRWPGAVWYTVYVYPSELYRKMTTARVAKEVGIATAIGVIGGIGLVGSIVGITLAALPAAGAAGASGATAAGMGVASEGAVAAEAVATAAEGVGAAAAGTGAIAAGGATAGGVGVAEIGTAVGTVLAGAGAGGTAGGVAGRTRFAGAELGGGADATVPSTSSKPAPESPKMTNITDKFEKKPNVAIEIIKMIGSVGVAAGPAVKAGLEINKSNKANASGIGGGTLAVITEESTKVGPTTGLHLDNTATQHNIASRPAALTNTSLAISDEDETQMQQERKIQMQQERNKVEDIIRRFKKLGWQVSRTVIESMFKEQSSGDIIMKLAIQAIQKSKMRGEVRGCYGGGNGTWLEVCGLPYAEKEDNKYRLIERDIQFKRLKSFSEAKQTFLDNGYRFTSQSYEKYYGQNDIARLCE